MQVIVERYHHRLIGFVRMIVWQRELAEELAQEVFLEAYRRRREITRPESLKSWLFTVARRKAAKELARKRYRVETFPGDEMIQDLAPAVHPSQAEGFQLEETAQVLHEILDEISPGDRELITLRFFGGLSYQEVADAMNLSIGSVGVKLNRALSRLKKRLEIRGLTMEDLMP